MRKTFVLSVAALLAVGIAACGGGGGSSSVPVSSGTTGGAGGGGGQTLKLSADPSALHYNTDKLSAKAGQLTIAFHNPSSLSHDVVLQTKDGREVGRADLVSQGDSTLTAHLQAGTYTYFCDVPGHRQGGMQGTLTVK